MKLNTRQREIRNELQRLQRLQDAIQGKSFLLRTPSKRQRRLLREFWAIAQKGGSAR